jgi:hypothetical protein
MPSPAIKAAELSAFRRMMSDFLHAGLSLPTVPFQKRINLAALAQARAIAQPRPSWCSLFTKAYGKVVATHPALRRTFISFPLQRMVEYPAATADVVIATQHNTEELLVSLMLDDPGALPLAEIDRRTAALAAAPYQGSQRLRAGLRLARYPRLLRRLAWWGALHASARAHRALFATYGVSSVANWGVDSVRPISVWTTLLHYGTVNAAGDVTLRLTFDHRVMDGVQPSLALNALEHTLQTDLLAEVQGLRAARG